MAKTGRLVTSAKDFFSEELKSVMEKQHIQTENQSFEYLVALLLKFIQSEQFFQKDGNGKAKNAFLMELYQEGQTGDLTHQKESLRRLGDVTLFISGFFPDSLSRKIVDVDYYQQMGGAAYSQLSGLQMTSEARNLFKELSLKFRSFSDVFNELSERSGLQSNSDLLRLYEKWLLTGSKRFEQILSEKGIQAVSVDPKVKH